MMQNISQIYNSIHTLLTKTFLHLRSSPTEVPQTKPMTKRARDYRKEYDQYQGLPAQKKRRADRNRARRLDMKKGLVHKGDGQEVDHKGFHRTGRLKNVATRVVSRHANRIRQPPRP